MELLDKIKGSLIGGAVGDALGYTIEFKTGIKDKEIKKYIDDEGRISDDTQMTMFTTNAIIWKVARFKLKGINVPIEDAAYLGYQDWLDTQTKRERKELISWIKDLEKLNVPRAPGNTCISALSASKKGSLTYPLNDSKGCGGVMRVAPLGIYNKDSLQAGRDGAKVSAITHGHPLGNIPSFMLATLISILCYKKDVELEQAVLEALEIYNQNPIIYDKKINKYFNNLIKKAIELSHKDISDIDAIKKLGEGWVAEETLAIAIYACLKYKDKFDSAIIAAVNHDGDSDSTGAVAGNIMGAYLGLDKIPAYYVNNLELKDEILELSEDLYNVLNKKEDEFVNSYFVSKYIYCHRDEMLKK